MCKYHPKYQVKRYPRSKCRICLSMWKSKKKLEKAYDKMAQSLAEEIDARILERLINEVRLQNV